MNMAPGPWKRLVLRNLRELDEAIESSKETLDSEVLRKQINNTIGSFKVHYPDIDKTLDGWADYNPNKYNAYLENANVLKSTLLGLKYSPPQSTSRNNSVESVNNDKLPDININVNQIGANATSTSTTSVNQNSSNTNTTSIDFTINFEEVRKSFEENFSLGSSQIDDILEKIDELENIHKSSNNKNGKWRSTGKILNWLATQGVDTGIKLLPIIQSMMEHSDKVI